MPSRRRHRRKAEAGAPAEPSARLIDSSSEAQALARELLSEERERPVVVVSVPREHERSHIDADRVAREVGELADVVVLATQEAAWGLTRKLPEGSQVYGGAARVYPVGSAWAQAPKLAPLTRAYSEEDTEPATRQLVSDALAVVGRDRVEGPPAPEHRPAWGTVSQLVAPSRALVRLDDGEVASVMAELTVEGVPIDGIVSVGQRVQGLHDPANRLLDLRESLVSVPVAVAGIERGDVIPVRVARVADDEVEVLLHPALARSVPRDRVTSNPADSLRSLFSEGEVVAARVAWIEEGLPQLRLDDVDDDEPVVDAPALLPWGPPWLSLPELPGPFASPSAGASASRTEVGADGEGWTSPSGESATAPGETSGEAAERADEPEQPVPERRSAARTLSLTVDALRAALRKESARLQASERERDEATLRARELDAELQEVREELRSTRTRLRNQIQQLDKEREARRADRRGARPARTEKAVDAGPAFLDPEDQWRHEVYLAWVERIPASDKALRPLPEKWLVGPRFLDSLSGLEGVSREKVAAVVVEVLTGLAKDLPGRDLHRLRTGVAGNSPAVTREDGAVAWRAALQRETPSARRLHYWELPGGLVELSRVVAHDDTEP